MAVRNRYLEGMVLSLLSRTAHGSYSYEMRKTLGQVSPISEATIYGLCGRLEKQGYIQADPIPHIINGRIRKYYRITEAGITALENIKKDYQKEREQLDQWLG